MNTILNNHNFFHMALVMVSIWSILAIEKSDRFPEIKYESTITKFRIPYHSPSTSTPYTPKRKVWNAVFLRSAYSGAPQKTPPHE